MGKLTSMDKNLIFYYDMGLMVVAFFIPSLSKPSSDSFFLEFPNLAMGFVVLYLVILLSFFFYGAYVKKWGYYTMLGFRISVTMLILEALILMIIY
jgi:hypothetical protein